MLSLRVASVFFFAAKALAKGPDGRGNGFSSSGRAPASAFQ